MKLSKADFAGTGKVFRFTLAAHLKNRSNIISVIIMVLFAMISVPIMSLASGGTAVNLPIPESAAVEMLYIRNETSLPLDADVLAANLPISAQIVPIAPTDSIELARGAVLATITDSDGNVSITLDHAPAAAIAEVDLMQINAALAAAIDTARLEAAGASREQIELINAPFSVQVVTENALLGTSAISFDTRFAVQYVYSILVMIISLMSASYIARAIVEEKASKLVELLMVSVRPLALILGKIWAVMVFVFGMFVLMAAGFAVSNAVTGLFIDVQNTAGAFAALGIDGAALKLSPITIVIVVISLVLGYFTFSILAGITGTGCSTMEDIEYAQMTSILVIMGGYIVSCIVPAFESTAVAVVVSLLPIVSVFCAPACYVCGSISFGVLCLAWVIQALVVAGLAIFCARVYNDLLIHRGARVKLRDLIAMAKRPAKEGVR